MLQEKSLPEGEDGFTAAQTAGHVEAAAGSPAMGVAGLSNSLSSPQSQDPEQVKHIVLHLWCSDEANK